MTQTLLGSIVSLWRYPVKSMLGEELNAAEVTKAGLRGDRAYALVDSSDGKVVSAKNPRKWPHLFDWPTFLRRLLGSRPRSALPSQTAPWSIASSLTLTRSSRRCSSAR
jgi:MOSC N-terminal beta barrel domain